MRVSEEDLIEDLRSKGRRQAATRQLRSKHQASAAAMPATQFEERQVRACAPASPCWLYHAESDHRAFAGCDICVALLSAYVHGLLAPRKCLRRSRTRHAICSTACVLKLVVETNLLTVACARAEGVAGGRGGRAEHPARRARRVRV